MKISFCILTIILFPLLMSCNKEENIDFNSLPENTEHINYYIKYEALCNSKYFGNVIGRASEISSSDRYAQTLVRVPWSGHG